jgi:hypothetical protein
MVEQPLIHETAGLFPVKIENEKQLLRQSFVLTHVHNVENRLWHKQNGGQLCTSHMLSHTRV